MGEASKPGPLVYALFGCGMLVFLAFVGLIGAGMWAKARQEATTCWAFVNRAGEVVIPGPFDEARPFSDGLAAVRVGHRWGFVDSEGREAIPPRFLAVSDFAAGLAAVQEPVNGRWGFLDRSKTYAIEPTWHRAHAFADGRAVVGRSVGTTSSRISLGQTIYSFGLIDRAGKVVRAPATDLDDPERWSTAWRFSEGLLAVQVGGRRWGYAKPDGTWAIEPRFEVAQPFSEGFAAVRQDGRWGVIRRDGTWLLEPRFGDATPFRQGRCAVEAAQGYAFVDGEGSLPYEQRYRWARPFSEGLAAVNTDAGWGFVDLAGQQKIAPQLADVAREGFQGGLCAVARSVGGDRVWSFVGPDGRPAWDAAYEEAQSFSEGLAAVRVPRP